MRWMEFIKVQTVRANVTEILLDVVTECKKCHGLLEAKVFNHSSVDDCSLCLLWNTDVAKPFGSGIGVQMSNILKKYGLVDHSVWVEMDERGEKIS